MKKQTDSKPPKDKAEKTEVKERGKYQETLKVKGSFLDIIRASVKDANGKPAKKKNGSEK